MSRSVRFLEFPLWICASFIVAGFRIAIFLLTHEFIEALWLLGSAYFLSDTVTEVTFRTWILNNLLTSFLLGILLFLNGPCKFCLNPIFVPQAEVAVVQDTLIKARDSHSRHRPTSSVLDVHRYYLACIQVLPLRNHLSQHWVLHVRSLNRVEHYSPVKHPKVWLKISGQWIVPVFEISAWPSGSEWLVAFLLGVIETILGPESSIKFRLKSIHKGSVANRLCGVVVEAVVVNLTSAHVVAIFVLVH